MYRVVCLLVCVSSSLGQLTLPGVCNFAAIGGYVTDLNITQMLGTWHQIARIENGLETGECSSLTVADERDSSGNIISVPIKHTQVVNKTNDVHNGTLLAMGLDGFYYMNLTGFLEGPFVIQATNYTDFAILYSCYNMPTVNATKQVLAWQYHRKAALSTAEQESVTSIVNANPDLNRTTWRMVKHDKASCGNGAISLTIPHALIILASVFVSKGFV